MIPVGCGALYDPDSKPVRGGFKAGGGVLSSPRGRPSPPSAANARTLHRFANPGRFLRLAAAVAQPYLSHGPAALLLGGGLLWGLFLSPADWQQGDTVRIMYIHVPSRPGSPPPDTRRSPSAASPPSSGNTRWRTSPPSRSGPVGASFTALCLATGSLWGKPMWGAWWVWDARLTSVLVLFFLYLGHIALVRAFDDPVRGARAGAILALAGAVNLPIIKFSVDWWNTLHQTSSITLTGAPGMHKDMLLPLLRLRRRRHASTFAAIVVARLRAAVMERRLRGLLMARVARA